ncbi:metallophosphoesterase [Flavobacterium rhizosphaerae]|uniref:Metallophosphoesterase n=1 Tax=Flavobacterium rhizosphaerae TaxID=3163298 RepID=A0ABW8YWR6_9FLAO
MNKRRDFLKSMGLLGLGATIAHPLSAYADIADSKSYKSKDTTMEGNINEKQVISILQTTDVHCQVHPHDELFWENGQIEFRKTGGYANLSAMLKTLRAQNPHTYTLDTGDMFQGSELSVETTGKAFVPVLNAMDYDLYLPGNWEVVYGKKNMQDLMGSLTAPKICTNMYHDLGEGKKGELIFQPYQVWNVAGVKIGFLGYTDPLVPKRQSPIYSKGILYTTPEENLQHYVDVLKNQEKCAFIIIIAHLGLSQQIALANRPECEGGKLYFGWRYPRTRA